MTPERWQRVDELFHSTIACEPALRAAFLAQACSGDEPLLREVESLISFHDRRDSFIETPASDLAAELLAKRPSELEVGQQVAYYKVLSSLGAGGMGEVYLAEDTRLGRRIALKLLPAQFTTDAERVRRFEQEARAASALNHPNIVTIHEIGKEGGGRFIITELVEGETLRQHMASTRMRVREALNVGIQVAGALGAAHAAGIVHRDIKPENIMLRPDGLIKVLDFGLAKLSQMPAPGFDADASAVKRFDTKTGLVMGTVTYMSPEQARGLVVDERSDIFSLGIVIYEMIAGRAPFAGATTSDVIVSILEKEPGPLERYAPEVPTELERIVKKALVKDRDGRYQAIKDLVIDLRNVKRELELRAKQDLGAPEYSEDVALVSTSDLQVFASTDELLTTRTGEVAAARTASSVGSLIGKIRRHKANAAAVTLVGLLLVATLTIALYKFLAPPVPKASLSPTNLRFTKITTTGKAADGVISPDGKYVVYNAEDRLMIRQTASGSEAQLLPRPSHGCTFTPDSNYVYCTSSEDSDPMNIVVQRIPVLAGQPQKIVERVRSGVSFSQDGKRMAFVRYDESSQEWRVIVSDSEGGNEQVLSRSSSTANLEGERPAWSPDGKLIAVIANIKEGNTSYYATLGFRTDTGAELRLTPQRWRVIGSIAWLPDGTGLLMAGVDSVGGVEGIWLLSYPGGEAQRLTNELTSFRRVSVTADGSQIVTTQIDLPSAIWLLPNGDLSHAKKLTPISGHFREVTWTPDGRIVYMLDDDLWIMAADGSGQRQLTFGPGRSTQPKVTSDGRYIVFSSSRAEQYNIWRLELNSGELKQLTTGRQDVRPLCSSDGQWVFYSCRVEGRGTVCKAPLAGGEATQIAEVLNLRAISPDDKFFAYQIRDEATQKLYPVIRPVEGGGPDRLIPLQNIIRSQSNYDLYWSQDGRNLLYSDVKDIWLEPLGGGPPKRLTDFGAERVISFAQSRDGRSLAVTRGENTSDVVLISVK